MRKKEVNILAKHKKIISKRTFIEGDSYLLTQEAMDLKISYICKK